FVFRGARVRPDRPGGHLCARLSAHCRGAALRHHTVAEQDQTHQYDCPIMTMSVALLEEQIRTVIGQKAAALVTAFEEVTLTVESDHVYEVMPVLRDNAELPFEQLIDLCGVDYGSYGKVAWSGTPYSEGSENAPLAGPAPETDAAGADAEVAPYCTPH